MLWAASAVLCETSRGVASRATEGRLLTERRRPGRVSDFGAALAVAFTVALGAATFRAAGLAFRGAGFFGATFRFGTAAFFAFAAFFLLPAGRLVVPLPLPVLRFAMIASVCLLEDGHFLTCCEGPRQSWCRWACATPAQGLPSERV